MVFLLQFESFYRFFIDGKIREFVGLKTYSVSVLILYKL